MTSIAAIRRRNHAAGLYWFSESTMAFFGGGVEPEVWDCPSGGWYFISSERRPDSDEPRKWTIRLANPDGSIDTVGEFQAYATKADAVAAVEKLT